MTKSLVIVESPAKARTISKFLSKDYKIVASLGHVRDLPNSKKDLSAAQKKLPYADLGVDVEHDFKPLYVIPPDKKKILKDIKEKLGKYKNLYIATDEDREGEAIGWHLVDILKPDKDVKIHRIVFHEITKDAILEAIANPRELNMNLIHAQQARRVLDRLVGYKLSPLLWRKIRAGLSAGRVQSVAVRVIVEREREIEAFKSEEYWTIKGLFETAKKETLESMLHSIDEKKAELVSESDSSTVLKALDGSDFKVQTITRKQAKRNPSPPFITSTLQQEAVRKLGFSVKKTMTLAQKLYEGVTLGKLGSTGLITYMRTDSTNLSQKALTDSKAVITELYGKEYALEKPRVFKKKSKGAQEAHEAIRPTEFSRRPDDVKEYLDKDEHRLYDLIWKRALASQMAEALLNKLVVDVVADGKDGKSYIFRATGQTIEFPGFMKAYTEGSDDPDKVLDDREKLVPNVEENEKLKLDEFVPEQHFTKPPPRYTEASLVKKLEEEGIGRPSTYAPTISTIIFRGYIKKEEKILRPMDVAFIVTDFLVKHFPDIVDLKFTANMEQDLDHVAAGKKEWVSLMREFFEPFDKRIDDKQKTVKREDVITEKTEEKCVQCGKEMVVKLGRAGKFLSCSDYPTCKFAKPLISAEEEEKLEALKREHEGEVCEKCQGEMVVKTGRFGEFLACSSYPKCKNTKTIVKGLGVTCPECKKGDMVEKKTKKGKSFFGCGTYPKCKFATWKKPLKESCAECKGLMVIAKKGVGKCEGCGAEIELKEE